MHPPPGVSSINTHYRGHHQADPLPTRDTKNYRTPWATPLQGAKYNPSGLRGLDRPYLLPATTGVIWSVDAFLFTLGGLVLRQAHGFVVCSCDFFMSLNARTQTPLRIYPESP